jgi:lipopolysaccharide export system permease protein
MILFFYVLREYVKYVIGTIVLTVFLFVLFDFIHKGTTNYFGKYEPATKYVFQYYIFQMPSQIAQALPIAGLLASVVAMILLSRTNEITAMRAAGMGPLRIGLPLAAGGMLLSFLAFFLGEAVVPKYSQKMHYVLKVQIEGESDSEIAEGAHWFRNGQTLVNFREYDPLNQTLTKVRIIEMLPNFRPKQSVEAEVAYYNPADKKWSMTGISVLNFRRNGTIESVSRRNMQVTTLPFEPKKLKKERRRANELSLSELAEEIRRGEQSGADVIPYRVEWHQKLAYPFAAFVVSLIGLKFGYKSERATETAKGILLAFGIGISYWFILSSGRALGLRGDIHPLIAAWTANLVILGITLVDAWRSRTR